MRNYIEVRITVGNPDEAKKLASVVVRRRLVACAQVIGTIASTYWWEGQVQQAQEWLLLMKTTADRFDDLAACVRELHSYEVPEIVAVPIVQGTPDYLEWIRRETAPERDG
ncbi:divalent-cation tolerance protein CutA [Microbispora rosea]|uniref:divalent-cation tolerance protein CutA n=1 Tax=Microbispora rosea TaxID=58117 RepID=UPI003D8A56FC